MKTRPILFSTPMVRAILEGRKTQARRVVKPQPHTYGTEIIDSGRPWFNGKGRWHNRFKVSDNPLQFEIASTHDCPYGQVGDVLWVRETWCHNGRYYIFKAEHQDMSFRWKPSIHMPKTAARIWLEITNIRAERLQGISESDAVAEGIEPTNKLDNHPAGWKNCYRDYLDDDNAYTGVVDSFKSLWQSINVEQSWNDNPWVWVIQFKRIEKPENV